MSPDDRTALAGEYVLGTLTPAEHADVAQRLGEDAALRDEVDAWQARLLPLAARAGHRPLPPTLWPRIAERLAEAGAPSPSAQPNARPNTHPKEPPAAPPTSKPKAATAKPPAWWRHLGLWQGLSGVAVLTSLTLAQALWQPHGGGAMPGAQRYVAVLQNPQNGGNGWVVEVEVAGQGPGRLRLRPVSPTGSAAQALPTDRSLQFWTKAPGAAGPQSLGLVTTGAALELPLDRLPDMQSEQLFEITLEPAGGSPLNRPTGPVLFIGRAVRLSV